MDEREILSLSEQDVCKIERVNRAIAERENAEAEKERHLKIRILFERAARDALPFLAYVVYVGSVNVFALFRVLEYDGTKLWIGSVLLALITIAPLLILPRSSIWWLKDSAARLHGQASATAMPSEIEDKEPRRPEDP